MTRRCILVAESGCVRRPGHKGPCETAVEREARALRQLVRMLASSLGWWADEKCAPVKKDMLAGYARWARVRLKREEGRRRKALERR